MKKTSFFACIIAMSTPQPLLAADISKVRIDGFITAAGSVTDTDAATFNGTRDELRFDSDSIVGVQINAPVNNKATLTYQAIAKGNNDFSAETEWAFVTMDVNEYLDFKAGRQRIPFFMISDFLEVGYAYPWVRPPVDVYSQLGFTRYDGVSATYREAFGDWDLKISPFLGSTSPTQKLSMRDSDGNWTTVEGKLDVTALAGINVAISNEYLSIRIGRTEGDWTLKGISDVDNYLAGVTAMGFPQIAEKFSVKDRHGWFQGVGLDVSLDRFGILAEYTQRGTDGMIADTTGWYSSAFYKIEKWQPYVGVSALTTDEDYSEINSALPTLAGMGAPGAALAGATEQFISLNSQSEKSMFAGVRYNLIDNIALKFEWQRVTPTKGTSGLLTEPDADYRGQDVNIYTIALDAIF